MKIGTPLLLIVALAGVSSAEVPRKARLADYSALWKKSVFTTTHSTPGVELQKNPLEDWSLGGLTQVDNLPG